MASPTVVANPTGLPATPGSSGELQGPAKTGSPEPIVTASPDPQAELTGSMQADPTMSPEPQSTESTEIADPGQTVGSLVISAAVTMSLADPSSTTLIAGSSMSNPSSADPSSSEQTLGQSGLESSTSIDPQLSNPPYNVGTSAPATSGDPMVSTSTLAVELSEATVVSTPDTDPSSTLGSTNAPTLSGTSSPGPESVVAAAPGVTTSTPGASSVIATQDPGIAGAGEDSAFTFAPTSTETVNSSEDAQTVLVQSGSTVLEISESSTTTAASQAVTTDALDVLTAAAATILSSGSPQPVTQLGSDPTGASDSFVIVVHQTISGEATVSTSPDDPGTTDAAESTVIVVHQTHAGDATVADPAKATDPSTSTTQATTTYDVQPTVVDHTIVIQPQSSVAVVDGVSLSLGQATTQYQTFYSYGSAGINIDGTSISLQEPSQATGPATVSETTTQYGSSYIDGSGIGLGSLQGLSSTMAPASTTAQPSSDEPQVVSFSADSDGEGASKAIVTVGTMTFTAVQTDTGVAQIDSSMLSVGGAAATYSGVAVSLGQNGLQLETTSNIADTIASNPALVQTVITFSADSESKGASNAVLTVGTMTFTAVQTETGVAQIDSSTLSVGGAAATYSGAVVSLGQGGLEIQATSTMADTTASNSALVQTPSTDFATQTQTVATFAQASTTYTVVKAGPSSFDVVYSHTTLSAGNPVLTLADATLSLVSEGIVFAGTEGTTTAQFSTEILAELPPVATDATSSVATSSAEEPFSGSSQMTGATSRPAPSDVGSAGVGRPAVGWLMVVSLFGLIFMALV